MASANCLIDYLLVMANLEQVERAGLCANTQIRWPSHKHTKGCSQDHPITMPVPEKPRTKHVDCKSWYVRL